MEIFSNFITSLNPLQKRVLVVTHILLYLSGIISGGLLYSQLSNSNEEGPNLSDIVGERSIDINSCEVDVDVSGAVTNPGVYCLDRESLVSNAIEKAGGFLNTAYAFKYVSQKVNLAEELKDNSKIYIPFEQDLDCEATDYSIKEPEKGVSVPDEKKIEDCIGINDGKLSELTEIPGVGEATAINIIEGRPYQKLEDLKNVKGIGDKTFENMKPYLCL
jgi:competence protein ComEA